MPLNIITAAEGDWFHSLSAEMQKQYLEEHPNSKYAKMAKSEDTEPEGKDSPPLKSVKSPSPQKHPAVVHKGEDHQTPISEHTSKLIEKLPKPVQTFFHKKEYEPNSPFRKKLSTFAHNSVHLMVKSVIDEVHEWKGAASALKDLATGTKFSELDHHKKEALQETAKFIATVAFTVGIGSALEGGLEGLGELVKSGVGVALAREAMTHTLAKSGAKAVVQASYSRRKVLSLIVMASADDEDAKILTTFIQHFADSLQHADINPNSLVASSKEISMLQVVTSRPVAKKTTAKTTQTAEKWSQGVTDKEKTHTPPGLFKESADKIARWMHSNSDSLKQAIDRISFYENRGGSKLGDDEKTKLADAKDKVRKLFGKSAKG